MTTEGIRTRVPNQDAVLMQKALAIVRPYQTKVGAWNLELTRLRAVKPIDRLNFKDRLLALTEEVAASREELAREALAKAVGENSLIRDLDRAMAWVHWSLTELTATVDHAEKPIQPAVATHPSAGP